MSIDPERQTEAPFRTHVPLPMDRTAPSRHVPSPLSLQARPELLLPIRVLAFASSVLPKSIHVFLRRASQAQTGMVRHQSCKSYIARLVAPSGATPPAPDDHP